MTSDTKVHDDDAMRIFISLDLVSHLEHGGLRRCYPNKDFLNEIWARILGCFAAWTLTQSVMPARGVCKQVVVGHSVGDVCTRCCLCSCPLPSHPKLLVCAPDVCTRSRCCLCSCPPPSHPKLLVCAPRCCLCFASILSMFAQQALMHNVRTCELSLRCLQAEKFSVHCMLQERCHRAQGNGCL